nr:hypothetical protein [Tanacetum cinerariifolium]
MAIEELKDLTSLSLDELIGNLKKESSDEECSTFGSKDEEHAMEGLACIPTTEYRVLYLYALVWKKTGSQYDISVEVDTPYQAVWSVVKDLSYLRIECLKPPKDKNQRAFVGGSWSDSGKEDDEKVKDETCLVAYASNEVCSESSYFSDENSSIDDLALDNEYDKL